MMVKKRVFVILSLLLMVVAPIFFGQSTNNYTIKITSPINGQHFGTSQVTINGSIENFKGSTATLYLNDIRRTIGVNNGKFSYTLILEPATNVIKVEASQNGVKFSKQIKVYYDTSNKEALWIELTWNQNHSDVDLYVYEPTNKVIYFRNKKGLGVLDHENSAGYGPEHYTLLSSNATPGKYRIRVHYYDTHGQTNPVTCHIVVKKYGITVINQSFVLSQANKCNCDPSSTGKDWYDVGAVSFRPTYKVSGYVKDTFGNPIKGVTIFFSGNASSIVTDSNGHWVKNGLKGQITVSASKNGWTFTPQSTTVKNEENNVDFIGIASSPLNVKP